MLLALRMDPVGQLLAVEIQVSLRSPWLGTDHLTSTLSADCLALPLLKLLAQTASAILTASTMTHHHVDILPASPHELLLQCSRSDMPMTLHWVAG